ncbi:hypothetical protein B0E54_00614 [Micromonospora sp. MH99]|nr:hypothetical protein [Micromonospora sp. MH99]
MAADLFAITRLANQSQSHHKPPNPRRFIQFSEHAIHRPTVDRMDDGSPASRHS